MSLVESRPEGVLSVRWVRDTRIAVGPHELERSFLLTPERLIENWPPADFDAIDEAAITAILDLTPELVILGSGPRQRFLPPKLQALLLQRGIGIETMDNRAAARTYNLLAGEGRRVVGAFVVWSRDSGFGIRD
jgi:uncharacterized protein